MARRPPLRQVAGRFPSDALLHRELAVGTVPFHHRDSLKTTAQVHTAGSLSRAVRAFLDDLAEIIAEDLQSRAQEAPMTPAKRTPTARRRVKADAQGRDLRPVFEQSTTADIN